ncbi:hypothetical protein NDA11_005112 [Ustilago hordei]|uniref:Related to Protein-tyrosine phosphatase gamma n=1 Tax=Ustilago hordei TaxID=120017 RepID=I2FR84_USTHO|nr:uncharacterized protein UHO2_05569 [Ustilago hordei]KAJ1042693.1 hypothetical protein NDA10_001391 [Ustilago hordei]KAJ1572877.1 hypothetical protein NDA15_006824 [Ustilago hordei]KAJ1575266.1 hypothetical protein NDA11_005112 [Ustilago hordei]KAJ1575804.1 hypothetical protein NDA12_006250 [Ustilago hordei]KAJ1597961.1 hypothetical protein NDA14_000226 [Ustilago hordei]
MSLGIRPTRKALSSLYSVLDYTDHLRLNEPDLGYTTTASSSNPQVNRYRDILAYDHALIPGGGPYLNAAYIPPFHPTSLSFITSQAPLPDTYTAFYTHLVQQRVRVLVNLTPLTEKGRIKANQYWSSTASDGGGEIVLDNGWRITSTDETKIDLEGGQSTLIRRVISIDFSPSPPPNFLGRTRWGVTQFHLTSWPDHGVFPTTTLLELMRETQMVAMPKIYPPPPTWIHCSAGVGRSGTLAAAYIAQAAIGVAKQASDQGEWGEEASKTVYQRDTEVELWDLPLRIVEHLRRYRARMVQTIDQFEAVYEIVARLATEAGLLVGEAKK